MATFILNSGSNDFMLKKYCKPHKIKPKSVISIIVKTENYEIQYYNKKGHYCTILVEQSMFE